MRRVRLGWTGLAVQPSLLPLWPPLPRLLPPGRSPAPPRTELNDTPKEVKGSCSCYHHSNDSGWISDGVGITIKLVRDQSEIPLSLLRSVASKYRGSGFGEKINLPVIRQYVDYLVNEQNVKNVFVNGTTGEGLSLSIQERKQLAEEWVCQGKDKLDHVIIHVGALNLPECQELARHAAAIGAGGIAVIAPFFFKPTNKDELVAFLQKVALEAPEMPFYYYHIPPLTGVKIRVEELLDGIKAQIPTFQGVKFSDTDLLDLAQCINKNETGEFEFLYGVDEQLLGALAIGANGAVGSTYNYLGRQTNLMLQAFAKPDFALAQQYQFLTGEFLSFVIKLGFGVAQTKAVMTFVSGIPMGPPRLPLVGASSEFIAKAKAKLESIVWPNGN